MVFKLVVVTLCVLAWLKGSESALSRTEIVANFNPLITSLASSANEKYQRNSVQYKLVDKQVKDIVYNARNSTGERLKQVRLDITNLKKNATEPLLSCVKIQETTASRLSVPILTTCERPQNLTSLSNTYGQLKTVSSINIAYHCQGLNPLEVQNQQLFQCIGDKIADVYQQIVYLDAEFYRIGNETLKNTVECVSANLNDIWNQLGKVSFGLKVCTY